MMMESSFLPGNGKEIVFDRENSFAVVLRSAFYFSKRNETRNLGGRKTLAAF
jgi:hypothetical protein